MSLLDNVEPPSKENLEKLLDEYCLSGAAPQQQDQMRPSK